MVTAISHDTRVVGSRRTLTIDPALSPMGTPKTKKQYVAKLSLTKAAKTLKREEAFKKKPKVMKVVRAAGRSGHPDDPVQQTHAGKLR